MFSHSHKEMEKIWSVLAWAQSISGWGARHFSTEIKITSLLTRVWSLIFHYVNDSRTPNSKRGAGWGGGETDIEILGCDTVEAPVGNKLLSAQVFKINKQVLNFSTWIKFKNTILHEKQKL